MKKFWFFDLDGTLADTDGDIRGAWKATLADLGLDCPDFDEKFVTGPSLEEIFRKLFPNRVTPELLSEARRLFGSHYDNDGFPTTHPYAGMIEAIEELKRKGARVFIVTNKRRAGALALSKLFGWDRVFEALYTGDMYRDDPAIGMLRKPALLARAMSEVGARAEDSVMVGDTVNDFEAAAANGVDALAVAWGYGTDGEKAAAQAKIATPQDILTCIYA